VQTTPIPRRLSTALLNSLGAGVVPRVGTEYIAVGRKAEVAALLADLENVGEGGAAFRFVVGRYGSGKSFLLQLIRNYAMERNFVVADADLSPERRLVGSRGEGLGTYRELVRNIATKTRPDGGAIAVILERWISGIQAQVLSETGMSHSDPAFTDAVEARIFQVASAMEGLVNGFDFATVLAAYWRGHRLGDDDLQGAALRWLRGEFTTKTDARAALGVRTYVDDDSWYEHVKLLASFVSAVGYRGLILLIDEAANLYKITQSASRLANYEKLLTMFNDTMQGKAEHLGIVVGGTPQFVEDAHRGLYSYEALRSRLAASRFVRDGLIDTSGPILHLQTLTHEEIFLLLSRLCDIHALHYGYEVRLQPAQLQQFMQEVMNRLGAAELLTPREVVRDFIAVLNLLQQNSDVSFERIIHGADFKPTKPGEDPDAGTNDEFAEFTL
jgi:P-loop Domain of unknown function (DUF2791)